MRCAVWFVACFLVVGCAAKGERVEEVRPPVAAAPTEAAAPPEGPAGLVSGEVVLPAAGQSVVRVAGCMAKDVRADGPAARSAPPAEDAAVRVTSYGAGIHVTHALQHNCCKHGETTAEVDAAAGTVRVVVKLAGEVCRCMCGSTLQTSVGLAEGRYVVTVAVDEDGAARVVHEEAVVIGAPAP